MINRYYQLVREYYGISQDALAAKIGVSHQAISLLESGESKTSRAQEFYNHEFMKNLFKELYGYEFETPINYLRYIMDNLTEEEQREIYSDDFFKEV